MKRAWLHLSARRARLAVAGGPLPLAATAVMQASPAASAPLAAHRAAGGGHTIIEGGAAGSESVPVTTLVAFQGGSSSGGGDFECLARAPPRSTGPGSGAFTSNVMHMTSMVALPPGTGRSVVFRGTATITGLGAGHDRPLHCESHRRPPRAAALPTVCGLTFHEILTDGHFDVS